VWSGVVCLVLLLVLRWYCIAMAKGVYSGRSWGRGAEKGCGGGDEVLWCWSVT
jgi:hypothetical protein